MIIQYNQNDEETDYSLQKDQQILVRSSPPLSGLNFPASLHPNSHHHGCVFISFNLTIVIWMV